MVKNWCGNQNKVIRVNKENERRRIIACVEVLLHVTHAFLQQEEVK
jgi:hypothetical protein